MVSSTETVDMHLQQSGLYADTAVLVKDRIGDRLERRFPDKPVALALSDRLLDAIVTPQFIQKQSQRALPWAQKIVAQPLDIQNNRVVVDTTGYKEKATAELAGRDIPDLLQTPIQNLVESVPNQLTLVNMRERPNSVIAFLTKAKMFYGHVETWYTISLSVAVLTGLLLVLINFFQLRIFFKYIAIAYLTTGGIILLGSYAFPYMIVAFNTGRDQIINSMVSHATYYYFQLTRSSSITLLIIGGISFLLYKLAFINKVQDAIDGAFNKTPSKSTKRK